MIRCIHEEKVGLFYPHLIIAFCKKAKVLMVRSERWLHPTMNTIRDSIYKHLITSHHKHVSNRKRISGPKIRFPTTEKAKSDPTSTK
ncbi:hypothetical protein J1N35_043516, partial [Gossypium stocksii]